MSHLEVGGFPFRVCMHFAARPDSLLTTKQAADWFDCATPAKAASALRQAVLGGWLTVDRGVKGRPSEYTAGPRILVLHGRAS